MNLIAEACDEKGLWVIVTTHSPTVVSRLPREHIRLLIREGSKVSIVENSYRHQLAAVMGGVGGYGGVLLVEDEVAREVAMAILDEGDPDLLRQFEIVEAGSDGGIFSTLSLFPRTKSWFKLAGAFDGDLRAQYRERATKWPYVFLPGHTKPEELLREYVNSDGAVDALSLAVKKRKMDIQVAKEAATGLEAHDWLVRFSKELNLSKSEVIRAVTHLWVEGHPKDVKGFVDDLRGAYNRENR